MQLRSSSGIVDIDTVPALFWFFLLLFHSRLLKGRVKPRGSDQAGSGRVGSGTDDPARTVKELENLLTRPDPTRPVRFRKLPDP